MPVQSVRLGGSSPLWIRGIGWLIIIIFFCSNTLVIPVQGDPLKSLTNIVALVVDEQLLRDGTPRAGLGTDPSTLGERIIRYGQDVQRALPRTRTEIITVSAQDDPYRIASILEQLYFEGDDRLDGLSQLVGIVLIGDVPMPAVEKNSHVYESVYPYTDFLDKAFLYDSASGLFREYPRAPRQQAEIWHGIIRPDSAQELASYLDKNHAYHTGQAGYNDVERKVFFADLIQEPERIGAEQFLPYELFLEHLEAIVNERFTTALLLRLYAHMQNDMNGLLSDAVALAKETTDPGETDLQAMNAIPASQGNILKDINEIPDRYTKQPILQMVRRFSELLGAYSTEVGDLISGSGRWTEKDVDSFPRRISMRDELGGIALTEAGKRLSTFERPVDLFAIDLGAILTKTDAEDAINALIAENELDPVLLTTDGLFDLAAEALLWRTFSIDEKYRYVLEQDVFMNASAAGGNKGYEAAYFVLPPTSRDTIELPHIQEGLFAGEDPEFDEANRALQQMKNRVTTQLAISQIINKASPQQQQDARLSDVFADQCGSMDDGVPLPQWFSAIMCWLRNLLPPKIRFVGDGRGTTYSFEQERSIPDAGGGDRSGSGSSIHDNAPTPTPPAVSDPVLLKVTPAQPSIPAGAGLTDVTVEALDGNGKIVNGFNEAVTLQVTAATAVSGRIQQPSLEAKDGKAVFVLDSTDTAGVVHLIASVGSSLLGTAVVRTFNGPQAAIAGTLPINSVYVTVAGTDGGARDARLAERILFNRGKAQAVTTLAVPEYLPATLLSADEHGVTVPDDLSSARPLRSAVRVSPRERLRVDFTDGNTGTALARVMYVLPPNTRIALGTEAPRDRAGIVVQDADTQDSLTFSLQNGTVVIRRGAEGLATLRGNGTMDLPASFHLEWDAGEREGMTFRLLDADRLIGRVFLSSAGLPLLRSLREAINGGIVVTSESRSVEIVREVNRLSVMDAEEQATLRHSFVSLNNRDEEPWTGWRGDFINNVLYASGEIVGKAAMHNASSTVMTFGDPVIALNPDENLQASGYGKDVGERIANITDSPLRQILAMDYNNDGLQDVLIRKEDGTVALYQNYNDAQRFKDMGTVVSFDDTVAKLMDIDANGDGQTDLLAMQRDGSTPLFANRGGAFVETPAPPLFPDPVANAERADFDGDGEQDIAAVTTDGKLLVLFGSATGLSAPPLRVDTLSDVSFTALTIEENEGQRPNILFPLPDKQQLLRYVPIGNGRTFTKRVTTIPPASPDQDLTDRDGNGIPDTLDRDDNRDGIPDAIAGDVQAALFGSNPRENQSSSFDLNGTLDDIGNKIDAFTQNLCPKKSGGCPSIFGYNRAFLAPGYSTIVGPFGNSCTQSPFPAEGRPIVSLPPFASVFRLYVMPTLTGGVGIAACVGLKRFPSLPPPVFQRIPLLGNCFVRSFNPLTGACKGLQILYEQLWNKARGLVRGAGGVKVFQVGMSAQDGTTSFDNGTYSDRTKKFTNVRPKAFPGFIMSWVERQVEEITTKLTDLPSITLILPDFTDALVSKDLKGNEDKRNKEVQTMADALDYLNSLPFLQLKVDDINVKYPALPKRQFKLMKEYYEQWVKNAEEELKSFQERADVAACAKDGMAKVRVSTGSKNNVCEQACAGGTNSTACIDCEVENGLRDPDTGDPIEEEVDCSIALPNLSFRIAAGERAIQRVNANVKTLRTYADFPQTIEKFVNYKTELIRQVTGYLDRIANVMGGYYLRNKLRVVKWQEMYRLIRQILKEDWQLLPDIFTQYKNSCTTCRNDRGNFMDCKMNKFKLILAPIFNNLPVIPFPKWPDIVIDTSNINSVITIHLPSPHFIPQQVVLPRLGPFRVPDVDISGLPGRLASDEIHARFEKDLDITIPRLPALPQMPDIFPKLPNLPLPQLPDIPPPPKIPKIAGALSTVLKVGKIVLKVWCLYKKGIPLIPEQNVRGVVEYQTERSNFIRTDFLDIFIPELKVPYVDQIRVDTFVNFTFNVAAIRQAVEKFVTPMNQMVTNLMRSTVPLHQVLDSVPRQVPATIRVGESPKSKVQSPKSEILNQVGVASEMESSDAFIAQQEREAYEALARDSKALLDVDAMKEYIAEQELLARALEPAFAPEEGGGEREAEPVVQISEHVRVQQMRRVLAEMNEESARLLEQVRDLETKETSGVDQELSSLPLQANAILALQELLPDGSVGGGGAQTDQPSPVRDEKDEVVAAEQASALDDILSAPTGRGNEVGNVNTLFLFDPVTRTPEKLIVYDGEDDIGSLVISADMDGNGSQDILYNLGSVIMLKRHLPRSAAAFHFSDAAPVLTLSDFPDTSPSINYVRTTDGFVFTGIFWHYEPQEGRIGYRLERRSAINSFDRERTEGRKDDTASTVYFAFPATEAKVRKVMEQDPDATGTIVLLDSETADSAPLSFAPGTSYGKFESILSSPEGTSYGTRNETHLIIARSDNIVESPVAIIAGGNYRRVPILQATVLDGRLSHKPGGAITSYGWDLHPDTDTDGDGIKDNDGDDPINLYAPLPVTEPVRDSIITLGAFREVGAQRVVLTVTDEAGNTSKTDVTIDVFVPDIILDETATDKHVIEGHLEPPVADEPITVFRSRDGMIQSVAGIGSDDQRKVKTDAAGRFSVRGWSTERGQEVLDSSGRRVALIDQEKRNIQISPQSGAQLNFRAGDSRLPSRLQVEQNGQSMTWVATTTAPMDAVRIVSDWSRDPGSLSKVGEMRDSDGSDSIAWQQVPPTAPAMSGGALLYDRGARVLYASVEKDGTILAHDSRITFVTQQPQGETKNVRVSVLLSGKSIAEMSLPWTAQATP